MLDIKLIRENPELIKQNLARRKQDGLVDKVDEVLRVDESWRKSFKDLGDLRNVRNTVSKALADSKGKDKEKVKEMKKVNDNISFLQSKVDELFERRNRLLMNIPNLMHDSVPFGGSEADNVEVRRWGVQNFSFEPKDHATILENLGLLDSERAGKVAGAGFHYLKEELVLLDMALQQFAITELRKKGYVLINPPYMLRRKPYEGVISFADFADVIYKIENDDMYLIATSEHPVGAMKMDEVFLKEELPLKVVGISPCFRKEVGSHGKYTRGLFRMHQFHKAEQFIFCHPDDSWKYHEELQKNSEDLYRKLKIPHRVVNVCTGDLGPIAAKKYDLEYLGADGVYREIGSNSNCTDYQARRLNVKYREGLGKPPVDFVHTLNNTAIATSRAMVAIIENCQQKDGSVKIPAVLQPFMGGIKKLEARK